MALPSTGAISFLDVRNELGMTGAISFDDVYVRRLAGKSIGGIGRDTISFSDLRGKSRYTSYSNYKIFSASGSFPNMGTSHTVVFPGYVSSGSIGVSIEITNSKSSVTIMGQTFSSVGLKITNFTLSKGTTEISVSLYGDGCSISIFFTGTTDIVY